MYESSNYSMSSPTFNVVILFNFRHAGGYGMITCINLSIKFLAISVPFLVAFQCFQLIVLEYISKYLIVFVGRVSPLQASLPLLKSLKRSVEVWLYGLSIWCWHFANWWHLWEMIFSYHIQPFSFMWANYLKVSIFQLVSIVASYLFALIVKLAETYVTWTWKNCPNYSLGVFCLLTHHLVLLGILNKQDSWEKMNLLITQSNKI